MLTLLILCKYTSKHAINYAKITPMKLPKPRRRGDAYRIEIMIDGKRQSATRDTVRECEQWAASKMLEHKAGIQADIDNRSPMLLHELMTVHYERIRRSTKGARHDLSMMRMLTRDYAWLTNLRVADIDAQMLTKYRDARLRHVAPSTVRRDFSYLSSVIGYAVTDLFIIPHNPCHDVNKPRESKPRRRRITMSEQSAILAACGFELGQTPQDSYQWAGWVFVWALESAMRRGEIMSMTWQNVHDRYVHLETSKSGDARDVPISPAMRALLDSVADDKGNVVAAHIDGIDTAFGRALVKTGIKDLQFRDTRHEAISRLVNTKRLPVEMLAKITGHKKLETLLNVYYNPTADELYDSIYGD